VDAVWVPLTKQEWDELTAGAVVRIDVQADEERGTPGIVVMIAPPRGERRG
jgi:hypothetical protein